MFHRSHRVANAVPVVTALKSGRDFEVTLPDESLDVPLWVPQDNIPEGCSILIVESVEYGDANTPLFRVHAATQSVELARLVLSAIPGIRPGQFTIMALPVIPGCEGCRGLTPVGGSRRRQGCGRSLGGVMTGRAPFLHVRGHRYRSSAAAHPPPTPFPVTLPCPMGGGRGRWRAQGRPGVLGDVEDVTNVTGGPA